ncbi:hypothetical protein BC826DRAFT_622645 [Russula brevipes]|nr:hypothetical protein BC826DRAFT_622645 [Russula brevipes]
MCRTSILILLLRVTAILQPPRHLAARERAMTTHGSMTRGRSHAVCQPALNTTLTNRGSKSLQIRLSQPTTQTITFCRASPPLPPPTQASVAPVRSRPLPSTR